MTNSDCIIIMGSNMAEAHPVGFQWVMEAKARGARVIHIDPRFTRTSAQADQFVSLRAGTDIAFLGGVINYILGHGLEFREYVQSYTNAAFLLSDRYQDTEDLDGLFSGYDPVTASYDPSSWAYDSIAAEEHSGGRDKEQSSPHQHGAGGPVIEGASGEIAADPTLEDPRCVFQVLKRHFARYTPEMVERVCGVPRQAFLQVCRAWTGASGRERTAALVYSVGWTQHTVGPQYIRAGAIIQLLLGNIGRPGGGIYALRGHASIQGSTDIPTLFNLLPGYLPMADTTHRDLRRYLDTVAADQQKGFWRNADTYFISLLKEYWGDAATADNDYCFDYLPRINGDHGTYRTVMDMVDGKVFGYFLLGQNPAVGSAHGRLQRLGLAQLDWLVVRDLTMIESATFWQDAPEVETGEIVPEQCATEVFFLPAAAHTEKSGTFTQTQRMLQWRDQAVDPAGDQRSDLWFAYHLGRRLQAEAGRLGRRAGSAPARPGLGLPHRRGRAVRRGCAPPDQRRRPRHRPYGQRVPGPAGGRQHDVRLLDLQRRVRRRDEPGPAAQAALGAGPVRRRMGLDLAAEPAGAVQPGLRRPTGPAVERAQGPRSGGTPGSGSGPATTSPTSRRPSRRTTSRRRARSARRRWPATTRSS